MSAPLTLGKTGNDRRDAMLGELSAKASLLLQNAIGPVISEVGRNYGRDGVIAFCAALQSCMASETRAAFGTGIAMEINKNVVANVLLDHQQDADRELANAAADAVGKMPLQ